MICCKQNEKIVNLTKKNFWFPARFFGKNLGPRGTKPNETVRNQYEAITKPMRNHTKKQRNHEKSYETDRVLFAGI